MKKIIVFSILLISSLGFSQEMLNSIPITLKNNRDVFQVVNNDRKETILFLSDRKKVTSFVLNDKMIITDSISVERPDTKYKNIIGYNGNKSSPVIFWGTSNHKEIYSQYYDFKNHSVSGKTFTLPLEKERYLQYFSENGKFYLMTIVLNSNIVKLYVFENDSYETKTIDLSNLQVVNRTSRVEKISQTLTPAYDPNNSFPFKRNFEIERIEPESTTQLTESSKKIKCYINSESFIITSDENPKFTQLITINLLNGKAELQVFPQNEIDTIDVNSNSFLFDEKLFQMTLNTEKIFLTVKDLNGNLISEYSAKSTDSISFKNSDFIRSSVSGSQRVLEKTSQFLRKINDAKCGISVYKVAGKYLLTIGNVSDVNSGFLMGSGGSSVFLSPNSGSFSIIYFNISSKNFDAYMNRKVVYFNSVFNIDSKHTLGEVPELAFDKMKKFIEQYYSFTLHTVYKTTMDIISDTTISTQNNM